MQITSHPLSRLMTMVVSIFMLGCAGKTPQPDPKPDPTPAWLAQGSGAFVQDGKNVLRGVGSATGVADAKLAMTMAESRATAEVSRLYATFVDRLMKSYMAFLASRPDAAEAIRAEEEELQRQIKTDTLVRPSGIHVVEHYATKAENPKDRVFYALAIWDLAQALTTLRNMKGEGQEKRDYLLTHAEGLFLEMSTEPNSAELRGKSSN